MRISITADWHLDAITNGVPRLGDLTKALRSMMDVILTNKPDLFVFAGDLCNPDKGNRTLKGIATAAYYAQALGTLGVQSYWLAGNHDVVETTDILTTLSPLVGVRNATIIERPAVSEINGWNLIFLPFMSRYARENFGMEEWVEKELAIAADAGKEILIVGHCTSVEGAVMGTETTVMPRGKDQVFPVSLGKKYGAVMANGHYHKQQITPKGVHIPGGLARFDFGEEKHTPSFVTLHL